LEEEEVGETIVSQGNKRQGRKWLLRQYREVLQGQRKSLEAEDRGTEEGKSRRWKEEVHNQ
jgi:hypothetical protein